VADALPDAATLASRFGLGKPTGPMAPVARGAMGRVWSLRTDRGRWAVKALFDWADAAGAETDVALQEAAAAAGVALPRPVRSLAGAVVETVAGRRWRVHAWAELAPPPALPVDPALAGQVGALLAGLHRLALPAPAPISPWFTRQPPAARWSELLAAATDAGGAWAPALREAMPGIAELSRVAALPPAEPAILCHCDLIPENVRPGPGGLVVIDWEHAGALPPGWELGYVVAAWCARQRDAAGARALVGAYRECGGGGAGQDLGIFAAAASAWLNFTAGLAARALAGGDADQQTFAVRNLTSLLTRPLDRTRLELLLGAM
jgi:Ser/Thr protein kinase RdoA (MazF antagonist)